jgi:uncharacterized membrane protein YfcA
MSTSKNGAFWIADFCMCWLALCGLTNVAIGLASLTLKSQLSLFGQPLTTPTQRFAWIGIYVAISTFGFSYMWWRQNWRYRLAGLLKIAAFWCVILAALCALQTDSPTLTLIAVVGLNIFMILYALIWACRRKGKADN